MISDMGKVQICHLRTNFSASQTSSQIRKEGAPSNYFFLQSQCYPDAQTRQRHNNKGRTDQSSQGI